MKLPHLLAIIAISLVIAFVALPPYTSAEFYPGSMAAPVAVDDAFTVHGGIQLPSLLANDFDPDGDGINFHDYGSQPQHGFLVGSSGHPPISYTANPGHTGPDSFTYRIRDNLGALSGFATVTLNVVNGAPVAVDDSYPVRGGGLLIPNLYQTCWPTILILIATASLSVATGVNRSMAPWSDPVGIRLPATHRVSAIPEQTVSLIESAIHLAPARATRR